MFDLGITRGWFGVHEQHFANAFCGGGQVNHTDINSGK